MSEHDHAKPRPVRPPGAKPTPVRESRGESAAKVPSEDVEHLRLDAQEESWTVRVLGRSGRAARSSPALLLLGFWKGDGEGDPVLEALAPGETLSDLSPEALRTALAAASEPRDPERRKPFFEDASQTRRR